MKNSVIKQTHLLISTSCKLPPKADTWANRSCHESFSLLILKLSGDALHRVTVGKLMLSSI